MPDCSLDCSSRSSQGMRQALLLLLLHVVAGQKVVHIAAGSTKLRLLHVSDTHYGQRPCFNVPSGYPCTLKNTTMFLQSIIEMENPDMFVHTGDIIDGHSCPPEKDLDELYGLAIAARKPWAASLGNHDEESTMTREQVVSYITSMPGGSGLTEMGPVPSSPGNFYVDVVSDGNSSSSVMSLTLVARLVFFDSRADEATQSINSAQLAWFTNLTRALPNVTTLAFYHIPLQEYQTAVSAGINISGGHHDPISPWGPNPGVLPAFQAANVVAGFCGHDHLNDFCVRWEGIELCYEGSPGFTAYGGVPRRARVTELQLSSDRTTLDTVRTWKRVDAGGSVPSETPLDYEILWDRSSAQRGGEPDHSGSRRPVSAAMAAAVAAATKPAFGVNPKACSYSTDVCKPGPRLGGFVLENGSITMTCDAGGTMKKVDFFTFGNAEGPTEWFEPCNSVGRYLPGTSCVAKNTSAPQALAKVEALCVGERECSIPARLDFFDMERCVGTVNRLGVIATGCNGTSRVLSAATPPLW